MRNKKTVVALLKHNQITRILEVLVEECFSSLLTDLKKAEAISLAIDSSCDRIDMVVRKIS